MAIKTTFEYVVYDKKESRRIGILPNVISDFGYNLLINTPGTSIDVTMNIDPSFDRLPPDYIMTEAGENLTTEAGERLTTESTVPLFSPFENYDASSTILDPYYYNYGSSLPPLIRNGNFVRVFEYSAANPNGLQVFEGQMKSVRLSYTQKQVSCSIFSFGSTLAEYPIRGIGTVDQSNTTYTTFTEIYSTSAADMRSFGQSFTTGAAVTNLFSITLKCAASLPAGAPLIVNVYSDSGFTNFLGLSEITVTDTTIHDEEFIISPDTSGITITPLTTYYFEAHINGSFGGWPSGAGVKIYYSAGGSAYSGGTMYVSNVSPLSFTAVPTGSFVAASDLAFTTTKSNGLTRTAGNVTKDQGLIFRSLISDYLANYENLYDSPIFGLMTFGTIETTGSSYRFDWNTETILSGLDKQRKLAPSNFYWYGSPADSKLHFRQTSTTADHVFTKGRHLGEVDIEFTIEDVKNVALLTGGDVGGGVNLYRTMDNTLSRNNYPRGLVQLSDNRITTDSTADAYMANALGLQSAEKQSSTIEVKAVNYNINSINVGQTVGFVGYGQAINQTVVQIVGKRRTKKSVILTLGMNPIRQNQLVEKALRELDQAQTIDNPDIPAE